jgi:hypothetical protein
MREGFDTSPFNPIPPVVWLVLLPVAALEIVFAIGASGFAGDPGAIGWRGDAAQRFALSPLMLDEMLATGRWKADYLMRFVTFTFVHASLGHALMAGVFLLALGKFVAEIFRPWAFLAIVLGAAAGGALVYSLVPGVRGALLGGYPAAYGLIGAFTFVLWARLRSGLDRGCGGLCRGVRVVVPRRAGRADAAPAPGPPALRQVA